LNFDILNELGGWEFHPEVIDRVMAASATVVSSIYDANPDLKGFGKGKVVLLPSAFDRVLGHQPTYRNQWIGSCVGRTGGMIGDGLAAIKAAAGKIKWPGHTIAASVYGPARVEIGIGKHGARIRGDGAVVAYAVESATTFGLIQEGRYDVGGKLYDLTGRFDDDDLCAAWGRDGMPDALEPTAHKFLFRRYAPCRSYEEARDGVAAGYYCWFGTKQGLWGRRLPAVRDSNGFLEISGPTAHSWSVCGTIDDGKICGLVEDNNQWGKGWVAGPEGPYPIGAGRALVTPETFEAQIRNGEAYLVSDYDGFPIVKEELNWVTL
jgi:hypothetical protein